MSKRDRFLAVWADDCDPQPAPKAVRGAYRNTFISDTLKLHCQQNDIRLMDAALLYFIREPLSGAVKIGISWNIQARLTTLHAAHPYELQL